MKILVIDDDWAVLVLVKRALESAGHQVTAADTGAKGLELASQHEFDLALCDLMLPDIHGLEVIRSLKEQNTALPVVVISALDAKAWGDETLAAGVTQYIQKPFQLDELRDEVAMADAGRARLSVILVDKDATERRRLERELVRVGCKVTVAEAKGAETDPPPDLLLLDVETDGADEALRWAGKKGVPTFVMVGQGVQINDDRLLRLGASLIIGKPVDADALLVQARFLAGK